MSGFKKKQYLNVLYQVCVFWADQKTKMAALAFDWLRHFRLLNPLNGIQRNLTGSNISTSCTKFVFFELMGKPRWSLWPLIGCDIFYFSSEPAERNSTNLRRSNISTSSTKFVFFEPIRKPRWLLWPLIGWDIFVFWTRWMEFNETWQEARSQHPLPSMWFSGRAENQYADTT